MASGNNGVHDYTSATKHATSVRPGKLRQANGSPAGRHCKATSGRTPGDGHRSNSSSSYFLQEVSVISSSRGFDIRRKRLIDNSQLLSRSLWEDNVWMRGSYNSYVTVEGALSVMPNRSPLARTVRRNGKPVSSTRKHPPMRTQLHTRIHIYLDD